MKAKLMAQLSVRKVPIFLVCIGFVFILGCLDLINVRIDDIFITLRYSRNLIEGYGPVYNPGQPVEGYSSPTWMFLMAALGAITGFTSHFEFYALARATSIIFGLLSLIVLFKLAKARGNGWPAIVLLTLATAACPWINIYNIAGMETSLVTFLLTFTCFLYIRWDEYQNVGYALGFAFSLGMLVLSRPEGIIYPVAIYLGLYALWFRKPDNRLPHLHWTLAIVTAISLAFLVFRFRCYGELLPNTLYAKNSPGLHLFWNGAVYVTLFLALAVIPFAPAAIFKKSVSPSTVFVPLYLVILAQLAFATYSGGDWMPGFRLLLPILPLILFMLIDQLDVSALTRERSLMAAVIAILVIASSVVVQRENIASYQKYISGVHLDKIEPYEMDFYEIGKKLAEMTTSNDRILVAQAGLIPYLNDRLVFNDLFGLTDKHLSKDISGAHGSRVDNSYFFAGNYEYVVYVIAKSRPDISWTENSAFDTGFTVVDAFINDPRFNNVYAPVYKGKRGAIFKKVGPG